jgi:hypothetical protein
VEIKGNKAENRSPKEMGTKRNMVLRLGEENKEFFFFEKFVRFGVLDEL